MVEPVSLSDLGDFLQLAITAFENPLFLAFTIMIVVAICLGIKRLMLEGL